MYNKIIEKSIKKSLFEPYKLGDLLLKNRIIMSSLSRGKADPKTLVPTEIMAKYYQQRSGFGFQVTEATAVSKSGLQVPGGPGIFTEEQALCWKKVVDAVHDSKGLIFIQLWHAGRVANPDYIEQQPLGPSPIAIRGENKMPGGKPYTIPKEMTIQDIKQILADYKNAAELSKQAGFDGVQVQFGNGFLIDQFLKDGTNQRKDEYGGSIENRSKFPLQVIDEVLKVYNPSRVGVRVTPTGRTHDLYDSDPEKLFAYVLQQLDKRGLGNVEIREFDQTFDYDLLWPKKGEDQMKDCLSSLNKYFKNGALMSNQGNTFEIGQDKLNKGQCDLVSFGRFSISNPDLPSRFKNSWPITPVNFKTLYLGKTPSEGYTDYPTYEESLTMQKGQ